MLILAKWRTILQLQWIVIVPSDDFCYLTSYNIVCALPFPEITSYIRRGITPITRIWVTLSRTFSSFDNDIPTRNRNLTKFLLSSFSLTLWYRYLKIFNTFFPKNYSWNACFFHKNWCERFFHFFKKFKIFFKWSVFEMFMFFKQEHIMIFFLFI